MGVKSQADQHAECIIVLNLFDVVLADTALPMLLLLLSKNFAARTVNELCKGTCSVCVCHDIVVCRHVMLITRGLCSFTSIWLLYTSIQLMPLADSVVLQFLSPVMVALAAPLLLKESPSR